MAHGITVLRIEGLALSQTGQLRNTGPEVAYSLARKVNRDEAKAIFLSCTNFRNIEAIASLEQELKKPVISSNVAMLMAMDLCFPPQNLSSAVNIYSLTA